MNVQTAQLDLWSARPEVPQQTGVDTDAFGCCSRYRACSDARKCLISQVDRASHCAYRKNLEAGLIFYGKNANGFSAAEYENFCCTVGSLPDGDQEEYNKLVVYFCYTKRGVSSVLWDSVPCLHRLFSAGLCTVEPSDNYLLSAYSDAKLRGRLSAHPLYGPLWKSAKPPAGVKKNTNAYLIQWIQESAAPFLMEFSQKYCIVSPARSWSKYMEEHYHDNLMGKERNFLVSLPRDRDDDGLFKDQMERA